MATALEFWYFIGLVVSLIGYVPLIVIIMVLFVKYPIRTFMKAKTIGLNPLPNRRMELVALSDDKELARTADGSFVFTDPDHFYVESKSRKPIVLMDSRVGRTISIDAYRLMALLKAKGYHDFDDMLNDDGTPKKDKVSVGDREFKLTKEMIDDLKKNTKYYEIDGLKIPLDDAMLKTIQEKGEILVKIAGDTLPVSDAVKYFATSIPGQVMETMLQYRSTVEQLRKNKKDLLQWIIILGFFVICVGFAVLLVSYAATPAANVVESVMSTAEKGTAIK